MTQGDLRAWLAGHGIELFDTKDLRLTMEPGGSDEQIVYLSVEVYVENADGHHFVVFDAEKGENVAASEKRLIPLDGIPPVFLYQKAARS